MHRLRAQDVFVTRVGGGFPLAVPFFTRDRALEDCTAGFVWFGPKASAVALDDRAADGESHPHATWLCRVKSFENRLYLLRINSDTGIAYRQSYAIHLTCSADGKLAKLIVRRAQSFAGVNDQVQNHL